MRKTVTWLPWILLILVIFIFTVWYQRQQPKAVVASDGVEMPVEKQQALVEQNQAGAVQSYRNAVKVAAPAVVNIFTTQKVNKSDNALLNDPVLREFFGNRTTPEELHKNENSLGSGVIVRSDGYILTNNHVIAQAEHIIVGLKDGRRAEATVVGTDPDTDLAVIKVDLKDLPVIPFKLSNNEVGDVVLAIGNPFGVGQTVTQGIISATGRSDLGINTYEDFIQTDAAINPGNSGGALIDVSGNLVGINTAIFSQSGGSLGIGFAIPAKICQQVLDAILKDGRVIRGWLGISLVPPQKDANWQSSGDGSGVVVAGVLTNGPAAQAGVHVGDRILSVNQQNISSASHLINYVALQSPNSTVHLAIDRKGESLDLAVKVGERQLKNSNSQYIPLPKR